MKLSPLVIALLAGVAFSQAQAADGTITFNGEVTDTTCVIDGNGTGATDFTVTLPTVATTALAAAGQTAGATPFNITVGSAAQPCAHSNVKVHFEPTPNVNLATGGLRNIAATTPAGNVEVNILNDSGQKIDLSNNAGSQTVPVNGGIAVMNYFGEYEAVGGASSAGLVETNIRYSVTYQ
ncbi:fimbrial protein [Vulcaniibacterium tengchongense]|uniref:Major type 1 subunit fimbrin (Pilin) n=1 Tax=Vulcaniibacterium tengchongense TaxID=1273429 RepID=A0A3N4VQT9_9GAMM|nr:fimbrial protein [Vulcaniibacterium tengchongense]RPE81581.1 major type 1 subunit fimbrin (pilin) [Vulcaniibacterium tengchongense]